MTSIPAFEAATPTSAPAPCSASRSRAAYGAPDAPVIPRNTLTQATTADPRKRGRRLLLALGLGQEVADLGELRVGQALTEDGHDRVAVLAGIRDVVGEELGALAALADRGQIRCAVVHGAVAVVAVTGEAAGA